MCPLIHRFVSVMYVSSVSTVKCCYQLWLEKPVFAVGSNNCRDLELVRVLRIRDG